MTYEEYINLEEGDEIRDAVIVRDTGIETKAFGVVVTKKEWSIEMKKERGGHGTPEAKNGAVLYKLRSEFWGCHYYQAPYYRIDLLTKKNKLPTFIVKRCDKYRKDETQKYIGEQVKVLGKGVGCYVCKCKDGKTYSFAQEELKLCAPGEINDRR